jgi:hypothetical protein
VSVPPIPQPDRHQFLSIHAGGDGLEDLERLEQDAGFVQVMREVERRLLPGAAGALAQASAARCAVALGDVAGPVP